ncbi:hypothetical protein, partial [Botryobacter ruber]|uniref:hypothetical protein n=1 Tax=Botryobacter ruber TaxID=2171629 RepID=UPI00196AC6B3
RFLKVWSLLRYATTLLFNQAISPSYIRCNKVVTQAQRAGAFGAALALLAASEAAVGVVAGAAEF